MKVSDFIAEFLTKKGIKSVFELSGGMITHILDSLNQKTDINIVTMHHEQAAAFAAEGYARVTGLPWNSLSHIRSRCNQFIDGYWKLLF